MTRISNLRLFLSFLLVVSLAAFLVYFSHLSSSGAQTIGQPAAPSKPKVENFEFLIAAPYWSIENGFVSTIEMKNYHVEQPLTITVILYPVDGPEIILEPISLNPSETRLLNIDDALASRGKNFTVGAAEIRYHQLTEGVFGANLTVLNAPKSLIYNFQFRLPEMTSRLEGLWWFYDNRTDGFIAVQNTSDKNVTVVPTLYVRERPYQLELIQLGPHKTKLVELRRELRKLGIEDAGGGGIKLDSSQSGAVIASGGLSNPEIGFSAPLRMDDPEMQAMRAKRLGQTLHALGLMIGADDPMMSMGLPSSARMNPIINLRNVSAETIQVTPVFRYQAGSTTRTLALKPIELKSQQLQRVELLPYWESRQIPSGVSSGSLEISYTGRSGSLLASVTSVDQTGSYVFDAKVDNKLAAGFHGEYWSTEGDNNTAITIKNITQRPATAWVSLQYDAGRGEYELPPLVLQAGESHMIDLKMIQREGMPGSSGQLLPETAIYGGMKLREEPGGRHFLIDAVVFNAKTATCGVCGYGCLYPQYISSLGGTYILALADSGAVIAVNAHMCDGTNQSGWECVSEFSTDSTAVATVDPWCQARGYGTGFGETTFRATAADVPGPHCGDQTLHAQRPVTVLSVTISGAQSVVDGGFVAPTFTLTPHGGTPTSYQWSWTAPAGVGNNPLVTFTPTNQNTTSTNSRWFANPNVACPSPPSVSVPRVSSDSYYNSVYTITGQANFPGGTTPHQNTTLTVNNFWNPGGSTAAPLISGGPTIGLNTGSNLWEVINSGTTTRNAPVVTINAPANSQFYNKLVAHENRHVQQYVSGMNSDLFTVASLMAVLSSLTDSTQAGLTTKLNQAKNDWYIGQLLAMNIRLSAMEQDAYSISDVVIPQYAYQGCQ